MSVEDVFSMSRPYLRPQSSARGPSNEGVHTSAICHIATRAGEVGRTMSRQNFLQLI